MNCSRAWDGFGCTGNGGLQRLEWRAGGSRHRDHYSTYSQIICLACWEIRGMIARRCRLFCFGNFSYQITSYRITRDECSAERLAIKHLSLHRELQVFQTRRKACSPDTSGRPQSVFSTILGDHSYSNPPEKRCLVKKDQCPFLHHASCTCRPDDIVTFKGLFEFNFE